MVAPLLRRSTRVRCSASSRGSTTISSPGSSVGAKKRCICTVSIASRSGLATAQRGTADEIQRITSLAQASQDADPADVETRARLNEEFHLAITTASHAPRLQRLVSEYRDLFASPRRLKRFTADETRLAIADHQRIARAIRDRDADGAEAAMRLHLRRAYADLLTTAQRDNVVAARPADPDV